MALPSRAFQSSQPRSGRALSALRLACLICMQARAGSGVEDIIRDWRRDVPFRRLSRVPRVIRFASITCHAEALVRVAEGVERTRPCQRA